MRTTTMKDLLKGCKSCIKLFSFDKLLTHSADLFDIGGGGQPRKPCWQQWIKGGRNKLWEGLFGLFYHLGTAAVGGSKAESLKAGFFSWRCVATESEWKKAPQTCNPLAPSFLRIRYFTPLFYYSVTHLWAAFTYKHFTTYCANIGTRLTERMFILLLSAYHTHLDISQG